MSWREVYLLYSALQKAIRWGEINDARYFAREIVRMKQPGGVLNRLVTISAEDVGLADPSLVKYVGQRYDDFEAWVKKSKIKKSNVIEHSEACSIIDRAVIAAALCCKSRFLALISFATLYDIYKNEMFNHSLEDYQARFLDAVHQYDEEGAIYNAYIIKEVFDSDSSVLAIIEREKERRNTQLIDEWVKVYNQSGVRLLFVGAVILLCRDLNYDYGEYLKSIDSYVSRPIEEVETPDRAHDMHTKTTKSKGRGLEHFFNEAASIRHERFLSDWDDKGKQTYFEAEKEGLAKTSEVVDAIKEKYENRRRR